MKLCLENHRRRSSVSESGLLSLSGSFLDATSPDKTCLADVSVSVPTPQELKSMSPRHQVFMELLHTEMNYVEILETIVEVCSTFPHLFCWSFALSRSIFLFRCLRNHWKIPTKLVALCSIQLKLKSFSATYHPSTTSTLTCWCSSRMPPSIGEKM